MHRLRLLVLPLVTVALGFSSFAIQYAAARPVAIDEIVSEFGQASARLELLENPHVFSGASAFGSRASVSIRLLEIGEHTNLRARGLLRGDNSLLKYHTGDQASCQLSMRPAPKADRAGFYSNCKTKLTLESAGSSKNSLVTSVRSSFMQNLRGVTRDASGLVAGLAIGDTSMLSQSLSQDMKTVSLTHLTAVSGANCAIVLAMIFGFARGFGTSRFVRLVIGLATLVAYVWLVGAQPSVLRAAVMAAAVMISMSLGRKTNPLYALALAILILLIADPWLALDFGFALSVAATAGILLLTEPLAKKFEAFFPRPLAIGVALAIAAQVFCLPVLLQLQGGISTYSVIANVAAESLVAPITILGILGCAIAWFAPWLTHLLTYLASLGTWLISFIAEFFAAQPNGVISWPVGAFGAVAAVTLMVSVLLWLKTDSTQLRNWGIGALSVITALSLGFALSSQIRAIAWPMRNWQVVACDVGQGDGLVIRSQGKIAVIDVGRESKPIDNCLSALHIREIDLLVLTHFDMDHIGGLTGAINKRVVRQALVSPFEDARWGATGTLLALEASGVAITEGEVNMTGLLGDSQWRILNPARAAADAEDSNDASLGMVFSLHGFNLLTLADIGERGQMRMSRISGWREAIANRPLVLKVSHHGSADQFPELIEALAPDLSLISVGQGNSYGHPTDRTLSLLHRVGSVITRTDQQGSIAVGMGDSGLSYSAAGHG